VTGTRAEALAFRLGGQIDELSRALAAAGATGPESMRLLESAALAAMHAVSLEALAGLGPEPVRKAEPARARLRLQRAA
jgi:hypothetical protein